MLYALTGRGRWSNKINESTVNDFELTNYIANCIKHFELAFNKNNKFEHEFKIQHW